MRIAIDARMMGPEVTRGIGRYIEELITAMLAIAPEHRYVLITRHAEHRFAAHPSVETVVADVQWYGIAEQLRMSGVYRTTHADVLHIPHWNAPILCRHPYVITIHDLLLRHVPDSAKVSTRGFFKRWMKRIGYRLTLARAIRHASHILVPTGFVARDVIRLYPSATGKITVTGEGMPEVMKHEALNNEQQSNEQQKQYLLYVGAAYPHKGLGDVIDAWPRISVQYPEICLKIAGEKDVFMRATEQRVLQEELSNIQFEGRVSDERLARLYDDAIAFVYPTHHEGFGLPPLEALARGCPVLSADTEPLPEVLGPNGAIFFRAGDSNAILNGVQKLMNDPAGARLHARQLSTELAARHNWKRAAACTLGAYGDIHFDCLAWHEG